MGLRIDQLDFEDGTSQSTAGGGTDISCRVYRTALIAITDETDTAVPFDNENFDTDTMHDNSTNNTRITFTTGGKYLVGGNICWEADPNGERRLSIKLNGSTTIARTSDDAGDFTGTNSQFISTIYDFSATDYVELIAYNNTAAADLDIIVTEFLPSFWAYKID